MAREKHVFGTNEIPHLWAHQTQFSARNAQKNLYFEGATIYSYGSHFPIAKHVTNSKGKRAILFTVRTYSSTTARHISAVRSACNMDCPVFEVDNPGTFSPLSYTQDVQNYLSRINAALNKASKRRLETARELDLEEAAEELEGLKSFVKFFGLKGVKYPRIPKVNTEKLAIDKEKQSVSALKRDAARRAKWAAFDALREEERKAKAAQDALTLPERLAEWRAGKHVWNRAGFPDTVMLRLVDDGNQVETSMGAKVPTEQARKLLMLIRAVMSSGREWIKNGHTFAIGHYSVDRITTDGTLYAGCHVIQWEEISRFAPEIESSL